MQKAITITQRGSISNPVSESICKDEIGSASFTFGIVPEKRKLNAGTRTCEKLADRLCARAAAATAVDPVKWNSQRRLRQ